MLLTEGSVTEWVLVAGGLYLRHNGKIYGQLNRTIVRLKELENEPAIVYREQKSPGMKKFEDQFSKYYLTI